MAEQVTMGNRKGGSRIRGLVGWVVFGVLLAVMVGVVNGRSGDREKRVEVDLGEFEAQLRGGNVEVVVIEADAVSGRFRQRLERVDGQDAVTAFRTELPAGVGNSWVFAEWVLANRHGAVVRVNNSQNLLMSILLPLVPWVLVFGFIWFFVFRQLRAQGKVKREPLPVVVVERSEG